MKTKTLFQSLVLMILVFSQAFNGFPALASPVSATSTLPQLKNTPPNNFFQWTWPLGQSWRITNGPHGENNNMSGLDMNQKAIPWGSTDIQEVRAAADGKVTIATSCYVVIDHKNGWSTGYVHIHTQVKPRQELKANDKIGYIETNKNAAQCLGKADAPHLHFRLFYKNVMTSIIGATFGGWTVNVEKGYPAPGKRSFYTKNGETKYVWGLLDNSPSTNISCPSPNTTFCDVPRSHPRYAAIEAGYRYGLFSGVLVNIGGVQRRFFYPSDDLLRQHGAIIVAHWLYFYNSSNYASILPPATGGIFSDITGDSEISRMIELFYRDGGTFGFSDHTFKSVIAATRKDFVYFVMHTLMKHVPVTNAQCTFSDTDDLLIRKACDLGLVKGNNGAFSLDQPISRDLAALIACRAFIATNDRRMNVNQCGDKEPVKAELILLRNRAREPRTSKYLCFTAPKDEENKAPHVPGLKVTSDGMVFNYEYASKSYKVGCPSGDNPLAGQKIVVSPSHGVYHNLVNNRWQTTGTFYRDSKNRGVVEDFLTVDFAKKLRDLLEKADAHVIFTRNIDSTDDYEDPKDNNGQKITELWDDAGNRLTGKPFPIQRWQMSATRYLRTLENHTLPSSIWGYSLNNPNDEFSWDVNSRPLYANYLKADMFVSLHTNARSVPLLNSGTETWVDQTKPNSSILGNLIQHYVVDNIQSKYPDSSDWKDKGVQDGRRCAMYDNKILIKKCEVLDLSKAEVYLAQAQMPAALIEVGYHNNPEEATKLMDPNFQQIATAGIYKAIQRYYTQAATYNLRQTVDYLCLNFDIEGAQTCNSLLKKMDAVLAVQRKGEDKKVINELNAFQNQLKAQRDKTISFLTYDLLMVDSNYIIAALGATK